MWGFVFILALLIPLLAVILDSAPARALASRLEREASRVPPGAEQRIASLETEVERLAGEVERLSEESRFLQRLIEERPVRGTLPSSPEGPEREVAEDDGRVGAEGVRLPPGERRD